MKQTQKKRTQHNLKKLERKGGERKDERKENKQTIKQST